MFEYDNKNHGAYTTRAINCQVDKKENLQRINYFMTIIILLRIIIFLSLH